MSTSRAITILERRTGEGNCGPNGDCCIQAKLGNQSAHKLGALPDTPANDSIGSAANRRYAGRINIRERSLSGTAQGAGPQRRACKDLAFYLVMLLQSFCLFSFAGPWIPKPEGGLFLRSSIVSLRCDPS